MPDKKPQEPANVGPLVLILLFILLNLAGAVLMRGRPSQALKRWPTSSPAPTTTPTPTPAALTVRVSGAVVNPGTYILPPGSRVARAIHAAGGFTADAFKAGINLAHPLNSGQIHVRHTGERGPVRINIASQAQLETLPGIGPALAGRIVEYRERQGPFRTIEDIKKIKGIGDATFEQIRGLITVY